MKRKDLKIGFTYGDPTGIGPEIISKVLKKTQLKDFTCVLFGNESILGSKIKDLAIEEIKLDHKLIKLGRPNKQSGLHAYACLKKATEFANSLKIKALITGPVSKSIVNLSVRGFKGQTDELAKFSGVSTKKVIMLFSSKDLRISLFTRHIPLKKVASSMSQELLIEHILLLQNELKKWFNIKNPKICILGLNPHAGENNLIGFEESLIIEPAIKFLKKKNVKVFGPFSPDATLASAAQNYLSNRHQEYDAYVSMYHDQALPMFKGISGKRGLNITLGLPFLRISPDHGTAFDIAGKNIADSSGISAAIELIREIF